MRSDWHGLLKILEITHLDQYGNPKWTERNLYNLFHIKGEQYILNAAFAGGNTSNAYIPTNFYFGLDNRTDISEEDTMETLTFFGSEPSGNGYSRVAVSSVGVFSVSLQSGHYSALGPILSFSANSSSWGPVKNLFLATTIDNSGILISSVELSQPVTPSAGEGINVRMALSLRDCP